MQFAGKEDIEAPIDRVFAALADFTLYERRAIRRGAEIERLNDHSSPRVGMAWKARFVLRGKPRKIRVEMTQYSAPSLLRFGYVAQGLEGELTVALVALSPGRTRMSVVLNLKPRTLSARLLVQSLRLARASLVKRFKLSLADLARTLEDQLGRSA
ncbi:SRPBCC family protein [Rhodobacteraceae bacterium F11138]|nr:SRPBCC family protein [Rhodobacteraceae bacterium F11138]